MKLPVLYKSAKAGEDVQWSIETKGESYIETYGRVGGKLQTNTHKCEPTNVGRSNERNAKDQAEFEARAKWQSKIDKGYRENRDEVADVPILPMLASKFEDRKGKFQYPVYVQPKLDGVRCIAMPDGTLKTRGGKEWTAPKHISDQIRALKLKSPLDGELYIHGSTLQDLTSYAKKNHGDGTTEKLNLVVYDMIMDLTFPRRSCEIFKILDEYTTDNVGTITALNTRIAHSEEEVKQCEKDFVALGYEGAIVRTSDLMYENNHRSNNLMKVKSFQDEEFKVIGFRGAQNGKVVWTCETKDKKQFDCYHKSTLEQGRWYYQNGSKFINKKLTVKFFQLTQDGIPQFPVGKAFRSEKDL